MATQGDAMRHLVHSVICGLIAIVVTVSGAWADSDTRAWLYEEYASGGWMESAYDEYVVNTELALPECSAMWEVYLMFQPLGANWMTAVFPNAVPGDPSSITVDEVINFCADQFGIQRAGSMDAVCPCLTWGCQADNAQSAQLAAARGCAMLLLNLSGESSFFNETLSDFAWRMVESLDNGYILGEGDAQQYFCRADFNGWTSEFWNNLDYSLSSCHINVINPCGTFANNCERTAQIVYLISSFYEYYGWGLDDVRYNREELYRILCQENLYEFPLFGSEATCINYVDVILDNLAPCWDNYLGGGGVWGPGEEYQFLEWLRESYYMSASDFDVAYDYEPLASVAIHEMLQLCANVAPDEAMLLCPSNCDTVSCTGRDWGTYVCQMCADHDNDTPKGFIEECIYPHERSQTVSDDTGTFIRQETCAYRLFGLGA